MKKGLVLFAIIILSGIFAVHFYKPKFAVLKLNEFGSEAKLSFVPTKDDNNNVIVEIDGFASENYEIKLDLYYEENSVTKLTSSEVIKIPGGDINARFTRDYYGSKGHGKAEVTVLVPENANGEIEIKLGIF